MAHETDARQAPLRVLHVVAPAGIGGLERVVQTLAAAQRDDGSEVHVAAVVGADALEGVRPLIGALENAGVGVHVVPFSGRAYLRERAAIADLARKLHTDIVHTHGYRPDVVDGGVARAVGAAAVTTVHGFTGGSVRNRFYEWMQRRSFRRFDAVVAVSQPLARHLRRAGVRAERLHLVVNAWRPFAPLESRDKAREALRVPRDAFLLGWVGRVSREKGLDVLLHALPRLADLPFHLAVIGEGPERPALEAELKLRGLGQKVSWCGTVPDAARLFGALDLFVLSSRTEGTPMVLFEAMSALVPIIASSVGGVPDMLGAREASLVPPENPEALAGAIRAAFEQRPAAAERARMAHARLARDSAIQPWVDRYRTVYQAASAAARP